MEISKEEMYTYGYHAAMRELKHKEEVQPPFVDDQSFSELWKLDTK